MSFVFRFPACVFLGCFITLLCPSFSTDPCPSASSKGNNIVKESFSHVTARGVHLQLIMSEAAWRPLHLPPTFPGNPERNYSAQVWVEGTCHRCSPEPRLARYSSPSQAPALFRSQRPAFLF